MIFGGKSKIVTEKARGNTNTTVGGFFAQVPQTRRTYRAFHLHKFYFLAYSFPNISTSDVRWAFALNSRKLSRDWVNFHKSINFISCAFQDEDLIQSIKTLTLLIQQLNVLCKKEYITVRLQVPPAKDRIHFFLRKNLQPFYNLLKFSSKSSP